MATKKETKIAEEAKSGKLKIPGLSKDQASDYITEKKSSKRFSELKKKMNCGRR